MACQCCTPTVEREPEGVTAEHAACGCGCGPDCDCGDATLARADTERQLEEIRRRVSTPDPADEA